MENSTYDIVIVGAGHAGCEAAWAAAEMGYATALITFDSSKTAAMSCNPAIGGIGKGQLVREVDALGGLMGQVIDHTGIHFRWLNTKKGPAVQAPRAQADRHLYQDFMCQRLEAHRNLTLIASEVTALLIDGKKVPDEVHKRILQLSEESLGKAFDRNTKIILQLNEDR